MSGRSNYHQLFTSVVGRNGGRTWITESAQGVLESQLTYEVGSIPDVGADARVVMERDIPLHMDTSPAVDVLQTADVAAGDSGWTDDLPIAPPDALFDAGNDAGELLERYIDRRYLFTGLGQPGVRHPHAHRARERQPRRRPPHRRLGRSGHRRRAPRGHAGHQPNQ